MFNDNHGPHDMMNLWEGNTGEQLTSDGNFGSASHGTLFRNHFTGLKPRFQIAWNAISLNGWSYHDNVVGNVLGVSSLAHATYQFGEGGGGAFSRATCYPQAERPGDPIHLPALVYDERDVVLGMLPGIAPTEALTHQAAAAAPRSWYRSRTILQ